MALSNCLFSRTFLDSAEFPTWFILTKLSANSHITHTTNPYTLLYNVFTAKTYSQYINVNLFQFLLVLYKSNVFIIFKVET